MAEVFFAGIERTANPVLIISSVQNGEIARAPLTSNRYLLHNLSPTQQYSIQVVDSCGVVQVVDTLNKPYKGLDVLDVSNPMFNVISDWVTNHKQEPLDKFLYEDTGRLSTFEKLAYIQQNLYGGQVFKAAAEILDDDSDQFIIRVLGPGCNCLPPAMDLPWHELRPFPVFSNDQACNCKIVSSHDTKPRDVLKGNDTRSKGYDYWSSWPAVGGNQVDFKANIYNIGPGPTETEENMGYGGWAAGSGGGSWSYLVNHAGPSKSVWLGSEGKGKDAINPFGGNDYGKEREVTRSTLPDSTSVGPGSMPLNYAVLRYLYTCVGANGASSNCGCDKTLKVAAKYSTELNASAAVGGGGGFAADKAASTRVEDMAMFIERDVTAGKVYVHGGGRHSLQADDNYGLNQDWIKGATSVYVGMVTMALQAASTAVTQGASIPAVNIPSGLDAHIATLITSSPFTQKSSGTNAWAGNLIEDEKWVTLSPSAERHFFVASAASVFFKGKFRWNTNAYTRSSYRLAGSIQQPGGANCCGYSQLKWLTYSKMGSAVEQLYMKDDISNWMTGKGPYYYMSPGPFGGYDVNSDIGSFTGPPPAGCVNPVIFPQERRSFFAQEETNILQAVSAEGGFWILNNVDDPLYYRILDATGRLVAQGTATEARQKLVNTEGFASGLYLINTSNSKGTQNTFKIVR